MRKWGFFKWSRDNQKRFADEVAAELDSKASKEAVDKLIAEALSQSGGTITKPLIIDLPPTKTSPEHILTFKVKYKETSSSYIWGIAISSIGTQLYFTYNNSNLVGISPGLGLYPSKENLTLGYSSKPWIKTFTQRINNGADIEIPTKGGTMALVSDIEDILRKHGLIPPETTEQNEQQGV